MRLLSVAITTQTITTVIAVFLNCCLLYLIHKHTKCNMGFYKYLLSAYAVFEVLFAIVVFLGMPLHLVSEKAWMAFSYTGILSGTKYGFLGPGLFCYFYELWLGFVIVNFTYRYIVVCRSNWASTIKESKCVKLSILTTIVAFLLVCTTCAFYFCTQPVIHPVIMRFFMLKTAYFENVADKLRDIYGITDMSQVGYVIVRFQNPDGEPEISGILGASTHYVIILASCSAVVFFTVSIWMGIKKLQNTKGNADIIMERQLFLVLMIQTVVPVVMCHIPSLLNLSFPFWNRDVDLGPLTPFFSVSTTLQKAIDPLVAMFFIGDYRRAIRTIFCGSNRNAQVTTIYGNTSGAFTNTISNLA